MKTYGLRGDLSVGVNNGDGQWQAAGGQRRKSYTQPQEEKVDKQHSRIQVGWTPVQVRSGRQRRLVEPCRRCPCWHWKSTLLPTCPHTDSRKKPKSQYRSPADANANRLQALNQKGSGKRPRSAKFFFSPSFFWAFPFNDYLWCVEADGDCFWRRWPMFVFSTDAYPREHGSWLSHENTEQNPFLLS